MSNLKYATTNTTALHAYIRESVGNHAEARLAAFADATVRDDCNKHITIQVLEERVDLLKKASAWYNTLLQHKHRQIAFASAAPDRVST